MASNYTPSNLSSGYRSTEDLNNEFQEIKDSMDRLLSREGDAPNQMEVDLDMNSNAIINVGAPVNDTSALRLGDINGVSLSQTSAALTDIVDTSGHYASNNVEGALDEIGDDIDTLQSDVSSNDSDIAGLEGQLDSTLTYSGLRALSTGSLIYVAGRDSVGDGGEGWFIFDNSDLSTEVAYDEVTTNEGDGGIYVAPTSDKTGASGAWVRQGTKRILDTEWYGDFQATVNAVRLEPISAPTSGGSSARDRIYASKGDYNEVSLDLGTSMLGTRISGTGLGTHIWYTGADHTVFVNNQNIDLQDMWVDHSGSGTTYNAVHSEGPEFRMTNVDVDFGENYAIYVNAGANKFVNIETTGGGKAGAMHIDEGATGTLVTNYRVNLINRDPSANGILIGGIDCALNNIYMKDINNIGIVLDRSPFRQRCSLSNINIDTTGSHGVLVGGSGNTIQGNILDAGGDGVRVEDSDGFDTGLFVNVKNAAANGVSIFSGANACYGTITSRGAGDIGLSIGANDCSFHVQLSSSGTRELQVGGDDNYISGMINGDVVFQSGTTGNVLSAVVTGTITDNGTNTVYT